MSVDRNAAEMALIDGNIEEYLARHERKELLRFLTCGSVDDGKSTLIGRLLYDAHMVAEDTLAAVERDSRAMGTQAGALDMALLVDGLKSEREQGITIDVAYRYFTTAARKYIIADTPGHEQFTRNMATGASTCDLAILLVDARHGVAVQTRRHSFITSLLGIREIVVAVNKMDLVDWSRERYDEIVADYTRFAAKLPARSTRFIPMSALRGENVVHRGESMPWYDGPTLLEHLDAVPLGSGRNLVDFRFPVQWVNRPDLDFRGFAGTLAGGCVRPGDRVMVLPSRRTTSVERIVTYDGDLAEATPPLSVTLTLADEVDCARGDMLVHPGNEPHVSQDVRAMVVWMDDASPLVPGKEYLLKHGPHKTPARIDRIDHRVDVNTLDEQPAPALALNEIGRIAIRTQRPLVYDAYARNRHTGAFILIDRLTNATAGAGMLLDPSEVEGHWTDTPQGGHLKPSRDLVGADERAARLGQQPFTLLFTGLSGSGKSILARAVERRLFDLGRLGAVIDGSSLRSGMSRDLGFSRADRSENLRRGMELARAFNDVGLVVLASFTAPDAAARERARELVGGDRFAVVYLSTPLEHCRSRDTSGLYRDAEAGAVRGVPGVDLEYEAPTNADLVIPFHELGTQDAALRIAADRVISLLESRGAIIR
ncbi:MAG: Bifunctional enzyme CysN/CysC [Planctomycetota bacterium]|jgi:bifunctional enzyme CysN/CysC